MSDDFQSPEEMLAHYGEGGPVRAAQLWIETIRDEGELEIAWPDTDPTLRLCIAQSWLYQTDAPTGTRQEVADALAQETPRHPLWAQFRSHVIGEVTMVFPWEKLAALSRPRPLTSDCELVVFTDGGGGVMIIDHPTPIVASTVVMRHSGGRWLVASLADRLPVPGWPPSLPED